MHMNISWQSIPSLRGTYKVFLNHCNPTYQTYFSLNKQCDEHAHVLYILLLISCPLSDRA